MTSNKSEEGTPSRCAGNSALGQVGPRLKKSTTSYLTEPLASPPSKAGPANFNLESFVLMHSTESLEDGRRSSGRYARPIWVFDTQKRAEAHLRDYAFQRSQTRKVYQCDVDEAERKDGQGGRLGWGIELIVRARGSRQAVKEREIVAKEVLWIERVHMDLAISS